MLNWVEADPAQVKMVSVIAKNIRSRREHKSKIFYSFLIVLGLGRKREWGCNQVRANSVGLGNP